MNGNRFDVVVISVSTSEDRDSCHILGFELFSSSWQAVGRSTIVSAQRPKSTVFLGQGKLLVDPDILFWELLLVWLQSRSSTSPSSKARGPGCVLTIGDAHIAGILAY